MKVQGRDRFRRLLVIILLTAFGNGQQKGGVVVEGIVHNSEAEKAGLREGDILLAWSRGDIRKAIGSPFDLVEVEIGQAPRGAVTIAGSRAGKRETWILGPSSWGLQTRPSFNKDLLSTYLQGIDLEKRARVNQAVLRWHKTLLQAKKYHNAWLEPWLLARAGTIFSNARRWKDADRFFRAATDNKNISSAIAAQLFDTWALSYQNRDDLTNAEKCFHQALKIRRKISDKDLLTANDLNNLGQTYSWAGNFAAAESHYRRALEIEEVIAPFSLPVVQSLRGLGKAGKRAERENYYRKALTILDRIAPDGLEVADSLDGLGTEALKEEQLDEAAAQFGKALQIQQTLAPESLEASTSLSGLGLVAWNRGEVQAAEQYFTSSLTIRQMLPAPKRVLASTLINLASLEVTRGDLTAGERYSREALRLSQGNPALRVPFAHSLSELGTIASERGDLEAAERYFRKALAIQQQFYPDSLVVALNLNLLAETLERSGDLARAEEFAREAVAIRKRIAPNHLETATSLVQLGAIVCKQGHPGQAEKLYLEAFRLQQQKLPESLAITVTLMEMGKLAQAQGDIRKAEDCYRRSLDIRTRALPGTTDEAEALAALGGLMRLKGDHESAKRLFKQAFNAFESQSARLGGAQQAKSSYRAIHAKFYKDYMELLLEERQPEIAFEVMEDWRARTLLEVLSSGRVRIQHNLDHRLDQQERQLQQSLNSKSNLRIRILSSPHTAEQLEVVNKEIEQTLEAYSALENQIREASPSYSTLTDPAPLHVEDVQRQLLDEDTLLLEYSLGEKRSYLWLLTPSTLSVHELPAASVIEGAVRRLYGLLTTPNQVVGYETNTQKEQRFALAEQQYPDAAAQLSRIILGPVAAKLENKRLFIVADGALQYIPFSLLPVPANSAGEPVPLIVDHAIVNLPSVAVLAALRKSSLDHKSSGKAVAVLADPVFDRHDSRLRNIRDNIKQSTLQSDVLHQTATMNSLLMRSASDVGLLHLDRLSFSRREAESILAVTPPGQGKKALDFMASHATATSPELAQYRIVHFATHGLVDTQHPELSGLVLSLVDEHGRPQNGFLTLEDIYNLDLPVDLVVLSACETGLGKEVDGEGLVGLTRGFMYAGATRVVASLWKVDDAATAELMRRFYTAMFKDGMSPAMALQRAQIEMWKQERWKFPYYWASFSIQGPW